MPRYILLLFIIGCFWSSCYNYPDGDILLEEQDVVITQYDTTTNFAAIETFAMLDSVVLITDDSGEIDINVKKFKEQYEPNILASIRGNMLALGYREVSIDSTPDVVMAPGVFAKQITQVTVWDPWWGNWWWGPGWGYPGYDYYYPWGWATVTQFTVGTLIVDMVDAVNVDPANQRISAIWTGLTIGIAQQDVNTMERRIQFGINQSFEQSPYLINTSN